MFDKTSEVFKEQLIKELIVFENAAEYKEDNKLSYRPAGVVKYTTPDISGEIELVITEDPQLDTGGCSLCKFTDNTTAVVISSEIFINSPGNHLLTLIAHELGHLISGHTENKPCKLPSLYREELKRTLVEDNNSAVTYLTVKAIVDGGYLPLELEADLIAARFVGSANVCLMQLNESFKHGNPTVVLEKYNRLKALNDILKDTQTPSDGYSFEIIMNNTNA